MEDLTLGNLLKIQREECEAELALHRAEIEERHQLHLEQVRITMDWMRECDQLRAEIERLREARLEGWRAGREAAAEHCWAKRDLLADAQQKQVAAGLSGRDYYGRRLEAELLSRSIRALPEPKEASHD